MTQINENQVDKLLDDIASIKSVLNENKPLMKQLLLPIHFRVISLIAGLGIIGVSALYYYLLRHYGNYYGIPDTLRTVLVVVVLISYVGLGVLKRILWMKSVKELNSDFTFGKLIRKIYSYQLFHVWIPVFVLMAFLSGFFYFMDAGRYIVTATSIALGIVYNSIGSITRIWQYLVTGYWLIVTGVLPIIFPDVSALIFLALSSGVGMLLFYFISGDSYQPKMED